MKSAQGKHYFYPTLFPTVRLIVSQFGLVKALDGTIQDCAKWHKTPEVLLVSTQPAELFTPLNNYFLN